MWPVLTSVQGVAAPRAKLPDEIEIVPMLVTGSAYAGEVSVTAVLWLPAMVVVVIERSWWARNSVEMT
jgi:hypothetical protein